MHVKVGSNGAFVQTHHERLISFVPGGCRAQKGTRCTLLDSVDEQKGTRCTLLDSVDKQKGTRCTLLDSVQEQKGTTCTLLDSVHEQKGTRCTLLDSVHERDRRNEQLHSKSTVSYMIL